MSCQQRQTGPSKQYAYRDLLHLVWILRVIPALKQCVFSCLHCSWASWDSEQNMVYTTQMLQSLCSWAGETSKQKTSAGAAHLLEAGSLTRFVHGDRTNSTKCNQFLLVTGLQAVSSKASKRAQKMQSIPVAAGSFHFLLWFVDSNFLQHLRLSVASKAGATRPWLPSAGPVV